MLPRSQRLVAAADHRLVARRGRRCRRGSLVVSCVSLPETVPGARLAVVVPKPMGNAPVRNRLRRRLQHLAAPAMAHLPAGSLIVVRAESGAVAMTTEALDQALAYALAKVTAT